MSLTRYDKGDKVRSQIVFKVSNVLTDPTTITVKVKKPSGTTTTYVYGTDSQVVKTGTGAYQIDLSTDESGTWYIKWIGTGTAEAAESDSFFVNVPVIP